MLKNEGNGTGGRRISRELVVIEIAFFGLVPMSDIDDVSVRIA